MLVLKLSCVQIIFLAHGYKQSIALIENNKKKIFLNSINFVSFRLQPLFDISVNKAFKNIASNRKHHGRIKVWAQKMTFV